jgi:glycosyltransferase involved in cell wall biosynthesis
VPMATRTTPRTYEDRNSPIHIFVPRWMDQKNTNAQNSNAKALLSRMSDSRARWTSLCSDEPAQRVVNNGIDLLRLSTSRTWRTELFLSYQKTFGAIFYPGVTWADEFGLALRALTGRRVPVIATLEGIIASPEEVKQISQIAGHPLFSQPGTEDAVPRLRRIYKAADCIIAISPFLAKIASVLYGEKVSFLPLGVDTGVFHSKHRSEPARCRVVSCGTVKSSKNPELFVDLAAYYPAADFVWFGDGKMRKTVQADADKRGLRNVMFAGPLQPASLAQEFRASSLLVLPSHAEGVPKVTQEAAACGLPVVLNGYFEAPSVVHNENGLVAWSDEQLIEHVGTLIRDPRRRRTMGDRGALMAKAWDWNLIAPQWENLILQVSRAA